MTLAAPSVDAACTAVVPFSFARSIKKAAAMAADPACTTPLLSAVIGSDPMLSAALLSRASVVAPRSRSPAHHLPGAIALLGMGLVQGVIQEVRVMETEWQRVMASSWGLANATATLLRLVAGVARNDELRAVDEETLHCCGLLHDLGGLVTLRLFRDPYLAAVRRVATANTSLGAALEATIGSDETAIGARVARAWRLPEPIASCIRHHARPTDAGSHQELVGAVHVARALARGCGFTAAGDPYVTPIDEAVMDLLGLGFGELETVIRLFHQEMDELEVYEGVLPG